MTLRKLIISFIALLLLVGAGFAYWYFMMGHASIPINDQPRTDNPGGFQPLNPDTRTTPSGTSGTTLSPGGATTKPATTGKPPVLRLLSNMPVGGFSASSTASTTAVV